MIWSPKSAPFRSLSLSGAIALALGSAACAQVQASDAPAASRPAAATAPVTATSASSGKLDVLFMIDDSSSMIGQQQKLAAQLPLFVSELQSLPNGLPDLHVAVVSSDMGAPGDLVNLDGCSAAGDQGAFRQGGPPQSGSGGGSGTGPGMDAGAAGGVPGAGSDGGRAVCPSGGLNAGQTFLSNSGGVANYVGDLGAALQCMTALGELGCGFEQPLSSVARALGADGSPLPAQNAGFLRPDAELAIIFLTNEDDCSAPENTKLYSLASGGSNEQNISNALGPIGNYRCNSFGHLCVDPAAGGPTCSIEPPIHPPADAQGTAAAPTLDLTDCVSAEGGGLLSSVSSFVADIRSLKTDPDNQIVVGAIAAPTAPYTVAWLPSENGEEVKPGELWPQVEHSCGAAGGDGVNPAATDIATDGSFGDPAVRLTQFVNAFGANGVTTSVCDPSYATAVQNIVAKIGAHLFGGTGTSGAGGGGAGATLPVCTDGLNTGTGGAPNPPLEGLRAGGCAVGGGQPHGGLALGLLALALVVARRRPGARAKG